MFCCLVICLRAARSPPTSSRAADAGSPDIGVHLPRLLDMLLEHAGDVPPSRLPGLIEGSAGVALTLHSIATGTNSGWWTCLLLN